MIKDIINKVIARLTADTTVNPSANITFFKNPFREIAEDELPCIKVAMMRGDASRINNNIEYQHDDQLIVAYIAQGNDNALEDALYDKGEQIRDFLIKDENNSGDAAALHHLISDLTFASWDMDLKNGEVGTGAIVLKFNIRYHTKHNIVFEDLEGVELTVKHTGAGEDSDAYPTESINIPTS